MGAAEEMEAFKKVFDRELERYFSLLIKNIKKEDVIAGRALGFVRDIVLAGGKRIRPMLALKAYESFGGKNKKAMMKVAIAIELIHVYLLIHDDICDRSATRHGKKTLHLVMADCARKMFGKSEVEHHGISLAIIIGDLLCAEAFKLIYQSGLDSGRIDGIGAYFQQVVSQTCLGQVQELSLQSSTIAARSDVMRVYLNKTAKYTFEGPLHVGAIAVGSGDKKTLNNLSACALPMGVAYQMQDDLLSLFVSEKKSGKSNVSDIKEGKQTMLVFETRKRANIAQCKKFDSLLGKLDISKKEADEFRGIIKNTGALEAVKAEIDGYLEEAARQAELLNANEKLKIFLADLAGYLAGREI